jgi:hypothetical protein
MVLRNTRRKERSPSPCTAKALVTTHHTHQENVEQPTGLGRRKALVRPSAIWGGSWHVVPATADSLPIKVSMPSSRASQGPGQCDVGGDQGPRKLECEPCFSRAGILGLRYQVCEMGGNAIPGIH